MTTFSFTAKGRYTEVAINRNLLFKGAPNAGSRTVKVTVKNIDDKAHRFTVVAATSTASWDYGQMVYTYAVVDLNPDDVREVRLDIVNASTTPPNPNAIYYPFAVNVFVDNETNPDTAIWPVWVLDITVDPVVHFIYDKSTKYAVTGSAKRYIYDFHVETDAHFFIADVGNEDYLPTSAYSGVMIAMSPLDRTGGVLDVASITSQGAGDYRIPLNPVTTGYLKVTTDAVVNYSKLGGFLGSAMSWITALGADIVAVFLQNKFIQHMFLSKLDPFFAHYLGVQNITVDAYVDPKDSTKVHILLNTYYNINDDPGLPLVIIAVIAIAVMVGVVAVSWAVVNVSRAEVQKMQIQATREMNEDFYKIMTDPNLSDEVKREAAKYYGAAAASISQLSGVPACDGLSVGNTCISWWVFAVVAATAAFMLVIKR